MENTCIIIPRPIQAGSRACVTLMSTRTSGGVALSSTFPLDVYTLYWRKSKALMMYDAGRSEAGKPYHGCPLWRTLGSMRRVCAVPIYRTEQNKKNPGVGGAFRFSFELGTSSWGQRSKFRSSILSSSFLDCPNCLGSKRKTLIFDFFGSWKFKYFWHEISGKWTQKVI